MKTAIFIDGGYLRVLVREADIEYTPDYIETIAHSCLLEDEFLLYRVNQLCTSATIRMTLCGWCLKRKEGVARLEFQTPSQGK